MSFAAQKFAWIERIVRDRNVPHFASRLATLISNYLNRASGDAWPTQKRLAADLGVCRRTIQYALDDLVKTGHLAVHGSRGNTNHYRPIFDTGDAQPIAQVDAQPSAHVEEGGAQSGAGDVRNLTTGSSARPFAHNPSKKNPTKKNPFRKSLMIVSKSALSQQSDFETWYQRYPKKVGKLNAEKAYSSIIRKKNATAEELLAGAMRYAAERASQDPRYTKHPTTWLNAGGWLDEPNPSFKTDSILAGLQGYITEER